MTNTTQSKSELKPTNIPWLGDIPADWEVRKITRIFDLISSGTTPNTSKKEYYENGTIKWVNTGDLTDGYLDDCEKMITPLAVQENTTLKVYSKNSLIIALYGATIGKLGILNFEATVNQACCVMSKSNIADVKFIYYWFLSNKDNIVRMSYGGGQPNISQDIVKSLKIPLPPLETQKDIVEYLNTKTNLISQFISDKQTMITRLKEQKQSLIHNVVTGKIPLLRGGNEVDGVDIIPKINNLNTRSNLQSTSPSHSSGTPQEENLFKPTNRSEERRVGKEC